MQPSLDVIIPCYNAAVTLETAVQSALMQAEVQNVWLVDDASTDNTRDVMVALAAQYPQVHTEYLAQNGGAAKARNWGALQSQADLIAFLDADDEYEPQVLAAAYMALAQFPYIGMVRLKCRPIGFPAHYLQHADFAQTWQRLEMTVGGNMVCRRSIFLAAGGFPQDALFCQFGGEDAALGIAFTRSSVVGTLFGEHDAAVRHIYRQGIHAERLLDSALYGKSIDGLTEARRQQAEAVTDNICCRLAEVRAHGAFEQSGIMALTTTYQNQ